MQMMVIPGKQLNMERFLTKNEENQIACRHKSVGLRLKFDLKKAALSLRETIEELCFPFIMLCNQGWGYQSSHNEDVDQ